MTTGDYTQDGTNVWTNGRMYLIFDPKNREVYFTDNKDNPVNKFSSDSFRIVEQLDEGLYFSVNDPMLEEICYDNIWDVRIEFEISSNATIGQATVEGDTIDNTIFTGTVHESLCYDKDGNHLYFIKDKNGTSGALIKYGNGVWGLLTPAVDTSTIWYQNERGELFGEYTPANDSATGKVIITPLS